MKRIFVVSIMWLGGWSLMAQPAAGKLFIGGELNLYSSAHKTKSGSTTQDHNTTNVLTLLPMAGYFVNEKIVFGASLGFDAQFTKNPGASVDKNSIFMFVINPFARYYLIRGTGGLFAEGFIRAEFGTNKLTITGETTNTQNMMDFSVGIAPGVYYYITPKLALEAKFGWFGFESDVRKPGDGTKDIQNTFGLKFKPDSFLFGLTFTLK